MDSVKNVGMFKCQFCDKECHFRHGSASCGILKPNAKPFDDSYEDCPFRIDEKKYEENRIKYPYDVNYALNHKEE